MKWPQDKLLDWIIFLSMPRNVWPCCRVSLFVLAFVFGQPKSASAWQMKQAPLMTQWDSLIDTNNPLPEYPRPQMVRNNWLSLNGIWQFQPGVTNTDPVPTNQTLSSQILVPFPMESAISGVMQYYPWSWYRRTFSLPANWSGARILLHLDAVDWQSQVYINGQSLGIHQGGYDPVTYDITSYLVAGGTQEIILQVFNPVDNGSQPRGKQTLYPGGIMYTSSSGIWQPIWLEPVDSSGVANVNIVPDIDNGRLRLTVNTFATNAVGVAVAVLDNGVVTNTATGAPGTEIDIPLAQAKLWSPANPFLYTLQITTSHNGSNNDAISSYFGMRKIAISSSNGVPEIFLNNQAFFGMGPLDQGFWPDGIYTAPTDGALKFDLQEEKNLGFNTIRKHIKVERQRWYYWADTLGFLVWQDMPTCNSYTGAANPPVINPAEFQMELTAMITNHWNSPSIIMWDIFNEDQGEATSGDGVGQASTASLVQLVQTLDPYHLVNQASGGSYFGVGNVFDNHNYPAPGNPDNPVQANVDGEYGGIGYHITNHLWNPSLANYGDIAATSTNNIATLYDTYVNDLDQYKAGNGLSAAIYTQITDVENECNGLMTYDRLLKPDPSLILGSNQKAIAAPFFQLVSWQSGSADYNQAPNWSTGTVPSLGTNAVNDYGSNNVASIAFSDPIWNLNDLWAGNGSNASGAFLQTGSTVNAGSSGGSLRLGNNSGALGIYTLAGGTLNLSNNFLVGSSGQGVLNVYGGALNIGNGGTFDISDTTTPGAMSFVNQTNGVLTCAAQLWLGENSGSATYNLSGGTMNLNNWVALGRAGGTGNFVMTGGVINKSANENFLVGTGAGVTSNASGTFTQTGGTVNCGGQFLIPEMGAAASGVCTLSNNAILNMSNWLAVGRENGTGILNIAGNALINITGGGAFDIGTSAGVGGATGTGTVNQTGGLVNCFTPTWLGEGSSGEPAQGTWNIFAGTAYLIGSTGSGAPSSLYVGQSGTGTNTLNLSGTGSIICSNYVSLGHQIGVTGVLNIGSASSPGGTFTMGAASDFNVGDSGAGVLNLAAGGGGSLTIPGTLYLTRGSNASGTVNLNGGSITASFVNNGYGFGIGSSSNAQSFNFNGGTLRAYQNTAYLIQSYVNTVVKAGGAVIDDGGYAVTINSSLANGGGGGGLTKLGAGTLYLNGNNAYNGLTLVSAGTLSGTGRLTGPVNVAGGATLAPGSPLGNLVINNSLTLNPGSATLVSIGSGQVRSAVAGLTSVVYGGSLVVTNSGTNAPASGSTYQLFNASASGSGNFSQVTLLPAGSGTAVFNPANGQLTISSPQPTFTTAAIVNNTLTLAGTGGTSGQSYTILTATNLALPLSQWTTNAVGIFTGAGAYSNSIPAGNAAQFFRLRIP